MILLAGPPGLAASVRDWILTIAAVVAALGAIAAGFWKFNNLLVKANDANFHDLIKPDLDEIRGEMMAMRTDLTALAADNITQHTAVEVRLTSLGDKVDAQNSKLVTLASDLAHHMLTSPPLPDRTGEIPVTIKES